MSGDPSERAGMSDAEDDAWTDLFETDAMRCCPCPSCNFYLPEGEYKPESTCEVVAAVERIIAARASGTTDGGGDEDDPAWVKRSRCPECRDVNYFHEESCSRRSSAPRPPEQDPS